ATSSLSPWIIGRWLTDPALYAQVYPFSLRPQAHEIIRTWAFYTLVKALLTFDPARDTDTKIALPSARLDALARLLPWTHVAISGWGLAPEGTGKISKSRGGGPMAPLTLIERYSADAARYWAASTGYGKDAIISEEKVRVGAKLATKLWNVARFAERFLDAPPDLPPTAQEATLVGGNGPQTDALPADRWLLSRLQRLIARVTALFEAYDYAAAKSETESFFWTHLTDNYLELAKERLYGQPGPARNGARATLAHALLTIVKLFAPFLPHVTEEIYQGLFAATETEPGAATAHAALRSLHRARWPQADLALVDEEAERVGDTLVAVATAVRRYKSEASLALGAPLARLELVVADVALLAALGAALTDLRSVTRARVVAIVPALAADAVPVLRADALLAGLVPAEHP
ncbi:MAG: class I tRNA ligase family protein, partial [Ktedonobacterales bacterium]|nr:class I tRNA ligase family protein [Ktedonobacterales bacterium]